MSKSEHQGNDNKINKTIQHINPRFIINNIYKPSRYKNLPFNLIWKKQIAASNNLTFAKQNDIEQNSHMHAEIYRIKQKSIHQNIDILLDLYNTCIYKMHNRNYIYNFKIVAYVIGAQTDISNKAYRMYYKTKSEMVVF